DTERGEAKASGGDAGDVALVWSGGEVAVLDEAGFGMSLLPEILEGGALDILKERVFVESEAIPGGVGRKEDKVSLTGIIFAGSIAENASREGGFERRGGERKSSGEAGGLAQPLAAGNTMRRQTRRSSTPLPNSATGRGGWGVSPAKNQYFTGRE